MTSPSLPPVPDAHGEPRPPSAPRVVGPWQGRYQVRSAHYGPEDRRWVGGNIDIPLLEAASAARPDRWRYAAQGVLGVVLIPAVVFAAVLWLVVDDRVTAYAILVGLLVVFASIAFMDFARRASFSVQAGAVTLAELDRNGHGPELRTYELACIAARDTRLGPCLRMVQRAPDKHLRPREIVLPFGLLEGNQRLWDLVYNGIRHSVAGGAEVDARTRRQLGLPPEPSR